MPGGTVDGCSLPSILESGAAIHVVEVSQPRPPAAAADAPDLLRVRPDQTHGQYATIFSWRRLHRARSAGRPLSTGSDD